MNSTQSPIEKGALTQWALLLYFALLVCSSLMNLLHALALIRTKKSATLSLILQISLVDVASLYLALTEITSLTRNTWRFPAELCPWFRGSETLLNTATNYLLICLNFHLISLWNFHEKDLKRSNRNPLTSGSPLGDSSNECLVVQQENRQVTIDYSKRKDDISIIFPSIVLWVVSVSLSIPNFTLSSIFKHNNQTLCTVVDFNVGYTLRNSILLFNVGIPSVLHLFSFILLLMKLKQKQAKDIDNVVMRNLKQIRRVFLFGIAVSLLYFITSFQRQVFFLINALEPSVNRYKIPPLFNNSLDQSILMYLSMLHYSGPVLRGFFCLVLLPKFVDLLRSKVFICCKSAVAK